MIGVSALAMLAANYRALFLIVALSLFRIIDTVVFGANDKKAEFRILCFFLVL